MKTAEIHATLANVCHFHPLQNQPLWFLTFSVNYHAHLAGALFWFTWHEGKLLVPCRATQAFVWISPRVSCTKSALEYTEAMRTKAFFSPDGGD